MRTEDEIRKELALCNLYRSTISRGPIHRAMAHLFLRYSQWVEQWGESRALEWVLGKNADNEKEDNYINTFEVEREVLLDVNQILARRLETVKEIAEDASLSESMTKDQLVENIRISLKEKI